MSEAELQDRISQLTTDSVKISKIIELLERDMKSNPVALHDYKMQLSELHNELISCLELMVQIVK